MSEQQDTPTKVEHVHRWVYSDERDVFVCTGCGAVEEAQ